MCFFLIGTSTSDAVRIEELRLAQEKVKREVALISIKQIAREKKAASRGTSNIHTPAQAMEPDEASTAAVVDGAPVTDSQYEENTRRYGGFFKSVVCASRWEVSFHGKPKPNTMKLLGPANRVVGPFAYSPEGMKNAYCALVEECGSDPAVFADKFKKGELGCNYYSDGFSTPNVLYKK